MKKYIFAGLGILIFLVVVIVFDFNGITGNTVNEVSTQKNLETANLEIEGMTCQSCALGVEYELKQVNGVADAKINYQDGTGTVTFDPTVVDAETIAKASTVYPAKVLSVGK
ncbi:MAG TPA: heavy metal-associated domain-containing protein [Bacteroidia bacterium]|nr:heavy metal-associated domain-containing protein [Bacteroidia bacterium]